jgi:hypothetical protein
MMRLFLRERPAEPSSHNPLLALELLADTFQPPPLPSTLSFQAAERRGIPWQCGLIHAPEIPFGPHSGRCKCCSHRPEAVSLRENDTPKLARKG